MISKKLERIFNKSNMKIDDVILSVGDEEEMMEVVRRFSDVNSNPLKELTEAELRREIQKFEEEFSAVVADMRTMREEQAGPDIQEERGQVFVDGGGEEAPVPEEGD